MTDMRVFSGLFCDLPKCVPEYNASIGAAMGLQVNQDQSLCYLHDLY